MEAASTGPSASRREADIAPAPEPAARAGWTPADPGPLGLAAFAGTTFMLSMINSGLVGHGSLVGGGLLPMVAGLALAYGGIAQLVAGIWEFRTGNTFGAVAFCSYGAFWISFFLLVFLGVPNLVADKGDLFAALSLYLYTWTIFTVYMFVCSLRTSGAVALTFLLLTITFLLLAIGNASLVGTAHITNSTIKLGGYLGIATAICAWYASFAAVINSTFGRVVAPVVPLRR
jgi:succinate-acetate transporter protein